MNRMAAGLALLLAGLACNLPILAQPVTPTGQAPPAVITLPATSPTPFAVDSPQPGGALPPSPAPTIDYQPVFEPAACAFAVPAGQDPLCGYLLVPENRARPGSATLRLHVAVFRSTSPHPAPDPVVYLSGGPGSSGLDLAGYLFRYGMVAVLETRDLILFDQRGTGHSRPRLDCPERQALAAEILGRGITAPENESAIVEAFNRCRQRLSGEGIDLSAYTSAASAADLADLARGLGYPALNLYAVSYGTRLALTVLRDQPHLARSVVLDSVYPPQANLYTALAPNAERAFNVFFDQFAPDYPNLRADFYTLVDQLNAQPVTMPLSGSAGTIDIRLDGGLLIDVLFVGLYNPAVTARMPDMIYAVATGEYSGLRERVRLYFDEAGGLGMQMAVQCNEEIPFASAAEADTQAAGVQPQVAAFYPASVRPLFAACASWQPAALDPRENQPVTSAVPALILAGAHDPITPPDWGRQVSAELSNAQFYEFSGHGHWVTRSSGEALRMALDFWNQPR